MHQSKIPVSLYQNQVLKTIQHHFEASESELRELRSILAARRIVAATDLLRMDWSWKSITEIDANIRPTHNRERRLLPSLLELLYQSIGRANEPLSTIADGMDLAKRAETRFGSPDENVGYPAAAANCSYHTAQKKTDVH